MTPAQMAELGFDWTTWYTESAPESPGVHHRFLKIGEIIPTDAERWSQTFDSWMASSLSNVPMNPQRDLRRIRIEECPGNTCPKCPKIEEEEEFL